MPFERLPPPSPSAPARSSGQSRPALTPHDRSSASSSSSSSYSSNSSSSAYTAASSVNPSKSDTTSGGETEKPRSERLASPLEQLSLQDYIHPTPCLRLREPVAQAEDPTTMHAIGPAESTRHALLDREQGATTHTKQPQQQKDMRTSVHTKGQGVPMEANAHKEREAAFPFSSTPHPSSVRPVLPRRTSSYSKRHASFDTPREVPLPYMPHRQPYAPSTSQAQGSSNLLHDSDPAAHLSRHLASVPVFDDHTPESSSSDSTPSSSSSPPTSATDSKTTRGPHPDPMDLSESPAPSTPFHSPRAMQPPRTQSPRVPSSSANTLSLFSRPFSSPDVSRPVQAGILSPRPMRPPGVPDRASTASLPLPAETPFHILSPYPDGTIQEDQEMRSAAPSRPSSSRPSVANQSATSSIPSSSASRQARRSSTLLSDLEHDEFISLVANRIFDRAYSTAARHVDADGSSSIMSDRPLPPPAPPTVLTPPPPPLSTDRGPTAPYEPFLANKPPPQDSYIAVDTKPAEYRLIVHLPGFKRDAM
ncbi:hypothetical protein BN946_scf184281.g10 [Trametes cinnabarina]|uniref:SHSP domain-containing protein n=1 Tax=Pycnoporus cinnabarinus TaxID=5643 RepID=A0A060SWS8_PYCCI|nr:hypothetical protein BN946_scf184281.g10 [Trametes cinnabarina]